MRKIIGLSGAAALLVAGSFGLASGPVASADEIVQSPDGNGYIVYWGEEPAETPADTVVMGDTTVDDGIGGDVEVAGQTVSSDDIVVPSPDGNGYTVYWGDEPVDDLPPAATSSTGFDTSMPNDGMGDSVTIPEFVDEFGDDTVVMDEPVDESGVNGDFDVVEPTMTDEVEVAGQTVAADDTVGMNDDSATAPIEAPPGDYRDENGFGYVIHDDVPDNTFDD